MGLSFSMILKYPRMEQAGSPLVVARRPMVAAAGRYFPMVQHLHGDETLYPGACA
jgi:hypothetical protein